MDLEVRYKGRVPVDRIFVSARSDYHYSSDLEIRAGSPVYQLDMIPKQMVLGVILCAWAYDARLRDADP